MATQGEDVYATLLLTNSYLPGALVLAHSLRDAGTTKKLAVLVTTDSVSNDVVAELQNLYDYVVPVERVTNRSPANLYLMDRPDLQSAFTKITLWRQLQFRRIVYMDADMVALRAPDELFNLPEPFSAAPDIGWPDLFNTGLMVLTPNMGDYYALLAMAQRGISFDGADQGLLNMHFKNSYNRLSFTYNVTPSAHYQYIPAYRHFQSSISAAHFIGKEKPWTQGREASNGPGAYDEMIGRWWAVYDRHYRDSSAVISGQGSSSVVQHYVEGEYHPVTYGYSTTQPLPPPADTQREIPSTTSDAPMRETSNIVEATSAEVPLAPTQGARGGAEQVKGPSQAARRFVAPFSAWDAAREPPPSGSKPEASNFPATHYVMSSDKTPFKAPERYPEPPKGMYYEVPKTPTYQKPAPIFPWEKDAPKPTRVFAEDNEYARPSSSTSTITDGKNEPVTPTAAAVGSGPVDPWQSFNTRTNAWDDVPEIERYIGALQKNRKGNIQVLQGYGSGTSQVPIEGGRRPSIRLTDFPTEVERPSLPVTPAPVRRPSFWGTERDEEGELPAAEGVPAQEEWDPSAQLEMLARRQSDVLTNKLSGDESGREIPSRPLPYGSEGVKSPTYVQPVPPSQVTSAAATADASGEAKPPTTTAPTTEEGTSAEQPATTSSTVRLEEPSFKGPGAMWEKDETYPSSETPLGPSEEEKDALEN